MCEYTHVGTHAHRHVWRSDNNVQGLVLSPLCEFQDSSSGQQACRTILAEPSHQTHLSSLPPPSSLSSSFFTLRTSVWIQTSILKSRSCTPLTASSAPVPVHTPLTLMIPDVYSSFISCDHPYLKTQRAKPEPPSPFSSVPIPGSPLNGTT